MLEQYITEQLTVIREKKLRLNEQLKRLCDAETEDEEMIKELLEKEDVGIEIFSPRNTESKVKEKIGAIREHIEELQLKQTEVSEQLAQVSVDEEHWEQLLDEAQKKAETEETIEEEPNNTNTQDPAEETLDEGQVLKEILARVQKCSWYAEKNRQKCKKELAALEYYLKALIAKR